MSSPRINRQEELAKLKTYGPDAVRLAIDITDALAVADLPDPFAAGKVIDILCKRLGQGDRVAGSQLFGVLMGLHMAGLIMAEELDVFGDHIEAIAKAMQS
ncbi:hypothetical protein [Azotobacter armeniacus]